MYDHKYTSSLEEEIKNLREKLALAYARLGASGNIHVFNEELLRTSQPLKIANKELKSANAKLDGVNNSNGQLINTNIQDINDDLNNYLKSNINGQLFIDNNLRLKWFSAGTVKQINLPESDIGQSLYNVSACINFETIIDDIKQVLESGTVVTNEIPTDNGKWFQMTTMPYLEGDKQTGAIITFNDITELKITQFELDKKNTALSNLNADLDNFVHTVSHDLLAPLANIEGSIDVLNHIYVIDPELNKFLTIINTSVKKFRALIRDISAIGKLGNESVSEIVDIEEQINNVEWSLENQITSSAAVITRDLEVKSVPFSRSNLRSILYNLVSNGIKFKGDDPPLIHIQTRTDGDRVILSVRDNGIGMSPESVDQIFNLYGRLNYSIEGHGIGLYLVKRIVVAAGGNIKVESELGKGSLFIISLKSMSVA